MLVWAYTPVYGGLGVIAGFYTCVGVRGYCGLLHLCVGVRSYCGLLHMCGG